MKRYADSLLLMLKVKMYDVVLMYRKCFNISVLCSREGYVNIEDHEAIANDDVDIDTEPQFQHKHYHFS